MVLEPDSTWNLFELSLQLSRLNQPELDVERYRVFLDEVVRLVDAKAPKGDDRYALFDAINRTLFEDLGFEGNRDDYHNPQNSYMACVLDQRRGIPVTLCILYQEVAKRLGVALYSIGMPAHFLLEVENPGPRLFVDAFNSGEILLESDCRELLARIQRGKILFRPEFLKRISNTAVVLRMLLNLKNIYKRAQNPRLLLEIIERRIPLLSDPSPEILERALIKLELADYAAAARDLEWIMASTPDEELKTNLQQELRRVRRLSRPN